MGNHNFHNSWVNQSKRGYGCETACVRSACLSPCRCLNYQRHTIMNRITQLYGHGHLKTNHYKLEPITHLLYLLSLMRQVNACSHLLHMLCSKFLSHFKNTSNLTYLCQGHCWSKAWRCLAQVGALHTSKGISQQL